MNRSALLPSGQQMMMHNTYDQHTHSVSGSRSLRVLYIGMLTECSAAPLAALLTAGIDVCGVVVPVPRLGSTTRHAPIRQLTPNRHVSQLPMIRPNLTQNIVQLAWEHAIPAFEVSRPGDPATLAVCASRHPDVACVVCFPWRIPAVLLAIPPLGFLNLHPSLLPAYRGPAPLFWTFRNGERSTGVTLHVMDEDLDTGDIVAQAPFDLPDGISGATADRMWSTLGARLMLEALPALQQGSLPRRKQPAGGTYNPWPKPRDFNLSPAWSARRAFNFMRGTAEWGYPYRIAVGSAALQITSALTYDVEAPLGAPYMRDGSIVRIQFTPGILRARLA